MASIQADDNTYAHQDPPQHHAHKLDEPLPGARGAAPAANYSTDVTNDSNVWKDSNERQFGAGTDTSRVMAGGQHSESAETEVKHDAFHEARPLGVRETSRGTYFSFADPSYKTRY